METNMIKGTLILLAMLTTGFIAAATDIPAAKNSIGEIKNKMNKITLKTIRIWGAEDDDSDEYLFFKNPTDVAHDSKNNIYFIDNNLNCIKVFDSHGKFLRQIGEKGQGPGTFFAPLSMGIDDGDHVWVLDSGNRRIQGLSTTGKSLAVFKVKTYLFSNLIFPGNDQIAFLDSTSAQKGKGIIFVLNKEGEEIAKIGSGMLPPRTDCPWAGGKFDSFRVAYGKKTGKYYVAYKYSQMIQSFQKDGKLDAVVFYDTPINKGLNLEWDSKRNNFNLPQKAKQYSECVDIAIDGNGLVFIVVTTREPMKDERTTLVNGWFFSPKNFPDKTDMYRLMVFGSDRKVVSVKQLNTYCSGIYIRENHLFVLDTVFHKVVYEYEYTIR